MNLNKHIHLMSHNLTLTDPDLLDSLHALSVTRSLFPFFGILG